MSISLTSQDETPQDKGGASLSDIAVAADPAQLPEAPDEHDVQLKRALQAEQLESVRQRIRDQASYRGLREKHAGRAFWFLSMWVIAVFGILLLDGFGFRGFDLSDTVLSILVGSTTVSAIGLVGIVVRGLFQH